MVLYSSNKGSSEAVEEARGRISHPATKDTSCQKCPDMLGNDYSTWRALTALSSDIEMVWFRLLH